MGLIIAAVVLIACAFCCIWYNSKRESFVCAHSLAIQKLKEINPKYQFHSIPRFDMGHSYDNQNFYDTVSPQDYLTYQLIYKQKEIRKAIHDTNQNKDILTRYQADIELLCIFERFVAGDPSEKLSWIDQILRKYWMSKALDKLYIIERQLFEKHTHTPITSVSITVTISLTNINGRFLTQKSASFTSSQILDIISHLQRNANGFYADPQIWQAICRVERAKVSNKMRFAVYQRDNNRCRKCGSKHNLEVDHIYPISKGGKTTFDNLQTLCHRCNAQKSNFIEAGAVNPRTSADYSSPICPFCHIPLAKRRGKHGAFWGCPNYPRCTYTIEA